MISINTLSQGKLESENSMMQYHPCWCIKTFPPKLAQMQVLPNLSAKKLLQLLHAGNYLVSVRWESLKQSCCSMTWLQYIDWLHAHEQVTTCCCLFIYLLYCGEILLAGSSMRSKHVCGTASTNSHLTEGIIQRGAHSVSGPPLHVSQHSRGAMWGESCTQQQKSQDVKFTASYIWTFCVCFCISTHLAMKAEKRSDM